VIGARRDERGFALPAVIFLVALLTLLLTSGLARVRADRQISEASEAIADAFAIAQSGLQNYLGTQTARPADGDSVRINLTGGYANVVSRLVRNPPDTTENSLYLVRSTGFVIDPSAGAAIQAQRSVAQLADWQTGSIERRAALVTANGLEWQNAAGTRLVNGNDVPDPYCGNVAEAPIPAALTDIGVGPAGGVEFQGSSGLIEQGSGTGPAVAVQTDIDWAAALSPDFVPDYPTFRNNDLTFPIQRVSGSLSLLSGGSGSGLLIVPGNLFIDGSTFSFSGVILVGGKVDFGADANVVLGLVVSGLNEQLGQNPSRTMFGGDGENAFLLYSSCNITRALAALTGMAPMPNAWLDIWAKY
jgi:type II secretory pathway pseudopilin PulG